MSGIEVHCYGPHIFHTNNKIIYNFVQKYGKLNKFINRIKAIHQDKIYSLPFNLQTVYELFGTISPKEAINAIEQDRVQIANPSNLEEYCLSVLGKKIYQTLIYGYTKKQWRTDPKNLPASIIRRLPVRETFDDNYYNHKYQGVPESGYTRLIENLLDGAEGRLNTKFEIFGWRKLAKKLIYTGPLDRLYDCDKGRLPYLTLDFKHQCFEGNVQGNAILNYTDEHVSHTRKIEHKHFYKNDTNNSILTTETPVDAQQDSVPYYPIPIKENIRLAQDYKKRFLSSQNQYGGGRLFDYKYIDMDQTVGSALSLSLKC